MKTKSLRPVVLFLVTLLLLTSSACGSNESTPEATIIVPVEPLPNFDCTTVTDVPQTECQALLMLYSTTNGDGWLNKTGWMESTTIGDWYGVKVTKGYITSLNLSKNQLKGYLPAELGTLTYLGYLDLNNNALTGNIPSEIGSLSNLSSLILSFNQLTGDIPASLGNLSKLTMLYLSENQLSGSVPGELGNLVNLEELYIYKNQLSGSLPVSLINLTSLNSFGFYGTTLCEPPTSDYQTWKTSVEKYYGTGSVCK